MIKIRFLNINGNEFIKTSKRYRKTKVLALILISIFLISEFSKFVHASRLEVNLTATPNTADVGELIKFNWTNSENYNSGWINFGDGNVTILTNSSTEIIHKYAMEGRYNVTLYLKKGLSDNTDNVMIHIKNDPPQFNISFPSQTYEDEVINISITDLDESDHDMQEGILQYVYDFADGNQTTSNKSSIVHKWKNAGKYRVVVTVIDDQGALNQKWQYLEIINVLPESYFTFAPDSASNNSVASYFGNFDFRCDILGQEPLNLEVYDWKDVPLETAIIKPNGDIQTTWYTETPHWSRIDECTSEYQELDENVIEAKKYESITFAPERFNMTSINLLGGSVKKVILHAYGKIQNSGWFPDCTTRPTATINLGGWKEEKTLMFSHEYWSWKTLIWDGLNGSQEELDNMELKIISDLTWSDSNFIDAVFCEIFYTHNIHVSIANESGYYQEVLRLYDHDFEEEVWIEKDFQTQDSGSIEFYIKSDDVSIQTWALSLYDDTTIGLKLLMKDDQWKFINGTTNIIPELGTPLDNTWYWCRLDFCASGAYLSLNPHQFRVTIGYSTTNITSDIYYFKDIDQVTKIRFQSGETDQGIAWIDAIGFNWDPIYNCGDNKLTVISYPEKSYVIFSADCNDSESDLPSLRYYWDFGDNTSGFGKYVSHSYLQAGIYIVNLTVKDDNGFIDWHWERVVIHNKYPKVVDISSSQDTLTINEGETIIFNTEISDDESDMSRLEYYWDFVEYDFDPYNTSGCEYGGWTSSHIYTDDYTGNMYLIVKDTDNARGYKLIAINVLNINPLFSIWDANIVTNISFEVYRNINTKDANFIFDLLANDEVHLTKPLNFSGSSDNFIYTSKEQVEMTLSKIWKIFINSSEVLPNDSWFRCYVKLEFLSGEELIISSPKLYGGDFGYWEIALNPFFYDNGDFTIMYPITFHGHIFDPSIDDLSLNVMYNVSMQLKINCSDSLPLSDSFTLNNISYMINLYEVSGIKYVNINASQEVFSKAYFENEFPVSLNISFTINPIIDLFELLEIQMDLTNLTILDCVSAFNYLIGNIVDDDGGENSLTITFTTEDNIEFENLCPKIESYILNHGLVGENITFYVNVADFDQIADQEDFYVANFKFLEIPLMPDNFELTSGICDWSGDLIFQNDKVASFSPDGSGNLNFTTSFCLNNVDENNIIKYLKLIYAFKLDSSHRVNLSLYNFHKNEWEVIDSSIIGTTMYRNKYSILSSEFINDTYEILVKLEVVSLSGNLYLDEFKLEYFSAQTSDSGQFENEYIPLSQYELILRSGSTNWEGDIREKDSDYITFISDEVKAGNKGHYLGTYSFEDEEDETSGTDIDFVDGDYSDDGCTISIKSEVDGHKKVLDCYDNNNRGYGLYVRHSFDEGIQASGTIEWWWRSTNTYNTILLDFIGDPYDYVGPRLWFRLDKFQIYDTWYRTIRTASDNTWYHFRLDFESGSGGYEGLAADKYYLYIDGVKYGPYSYNHVNSGIKRIQICTGEGTLHAYFDAFGYSWDPNYTIGDNMNFLGGLELESHFQIQGIRPGDEITSLDLHWSYKTNTSKVIDLSIYNYTAQSYNKIDSSIYSNFENCNYSITSSDYYNDEHIIRLKIEGENSNIFEFYLNQLKIHYTWTKGTYNENGVFHDIPNLYEDITMINGTLESLGELVFQNNDYVVFNSTDYSLNFNSLFELEFVLPGDAIDSLTLNYSYKTDIPQLINISLYNFTADSWYLIESSVHTAFFNESYSIPIEDNDFFDADFKLILNIEGINQASNFRLYLDQFMIEYKFTSYYFTGNCSGIIDTIEGDYITFESSQYSGEYFGTFSFEDDDDGTMPEGWSDHSVNLAYGEIITEFQGHKKVLKAVDENQVWYYDLRRSFVSTQSNGTVEFWWAVSSASYRHTVSLYNILELRIESGHFQYCDDSGWHTLEETSVSTNTWYHIRIDFAQTSNAYMGLSQYTYRFFIDDTKYGPYNSLGTSNSGGLRLYSRSDPRFYSGYYDAFGFSWDPDYKVGDNKNPISYVNEILNLLLYKMDSHRFDLFESCTVFYNLKTSKFANTSVFIYNFIGENWFEIDFLQTDNSMYYNGSYTFYDKDFVSSDFKVKIQLFAKHWHYQSFNLYVKTLQAKYNWSMALADFGLNSYTIDLQVSYNMSSRYSTVFYTEYIFEYEGYYLVIMSADDGNSISRVGKLIKINNTLPLGLIEDFPEEIFEDQKLQCNSDVFISGTNATVEDYKIYWLFGDGSFSNDPAPIHAYANSGEYNISLTVVDCFGNSYTDVKNITIIERAPDIVGPFTFYGIEGQALTLDVEIFDAFLDEVNIDYEWFNSSGLVSTNKKPVLILQDGTYQYILNVTDNLGKIATTVITTIVEDSPPLVLVSNYIYSGQSVSENEGFFTGTPDGPGELELKAYGYDTFNDNDKLDYYWRITNDNSTYQSTNMNNGISSTVKFRVKETGVYLGQVKIVSGNKTATANFIINAIIDSNGNGISDELEAIILEFYEDITAYDDSDDDGLTDLYELTYNNSDPSDPDSDDDGLWDGFNYETGIGEQSFSTKPNDPDCDNDELIDGMEFFGWNVTTDIFGTIAVNSDPWKYDTDGDGLNDYEEYYYGTNPRTSDTDTDGIIDPLDPYPTKYDYDGDGLSDKYELVLGTALNVSDTDNDGISDGEEILGWFKTNPLSADSDHDFASDSAELQNYHVAIDDRYDLDEPVSISFEINCERSVSAQIAFMITFGEAINEDGKVYGIQDIPDLNISIIKVDDNLLLFNTTTNCTRYYSKVIDIKEIIESNGKDYRGEYMVQINNTEAGCILEQFEIEIAGYLNPNDADFDNDGIMDGVEMGLLVRGTDTIDHSDLYGENTTVSFPMEETCWWTLDEGSGITADDLSFYENDGTLTNMESIDWKSGKIGDHALQFDGVNEYIDCGNEYFLDFERNDTFTLSAWIKTTYSGKAILSKMDVSENYRGYDLFIDSTGVIRAHLINEVDSNEIIVDGSTAINDNLWHFIVLTYNGSSSASGMKLYIDGSLDNLTIIKDMLNATIHTNVDFLIGARTGGNYFSGQIDDVRVYNFDLTQDNITWLYNSGNGRPSKTLNGKDVAEVNTQYYLEIPFVGVVYDANLTLTIESEGILIGAGNITIEIIKEEINCSISNVILSSVFNEFSNTSQFSYEKFIDITPYVNNNSITEYYGKYLLNVEIHDTDYRDKFVITEFYLQTDTYMEAGTTDTEGWITNPGLKDTDGDGWNDYKEIFIEGTNPISADTDGDGAWDKYDRDPLQDVMLEISPISGTIWFPETRKLEIVISFKLEGTGESFSIYTQRHWTTVQGEQSFSLYYVTWYEWTAYFDGTHNNPEALHYYINIDDDIRVQGNELEFKLQLWRINKWWDTKHISGYDTYAINEVGYSEIVNVTSIEEIQSVQMKTEAKIEVSTIGVEKANTLAIYETNGTTFNGHYQEQERMNILQLYVNDNGTGTPFVKGPNVIVIPTSLFTETVFNAYVQNETLSETPIYSDNEDIFMFISVGRDGSIEQACEEIDFIFIRFDISSEDAMEVLILLLTCLVNETTNETAIVYSYVSMKLNDTTAVMMNLPFSVLGFIPWFCNFTESPMGSKPETKDDWFWKPLKSLGKAIVGVVIFIGMAIVAFVELIIDFVAEILMEWLPILEYILWLIIRVIVLIFAWIIFAITLIVVIFGFLGILSIITSLNCLSGCSTNISLNKFTIQKEKMDICIGYSLSSEYIEYFKIEIPAVCFYFNKENTSFISSFSSFNSLSISNIQLSDDFYDTPNMTQANSSTYQSNSISWDKQVSQIINGAATMMGLFGGIMGIVGFAIGLTQDDINGVRVLLFFISVLIISLRLLIINVVRAGGLSYQFMAGAAYGLFFTALMVSTTYEKLFPIIHFSKLGINFLIFWAILSFFTSIIGGFLPNLALFFSSANVIFGIFKVIFGVRSLRLGISESKARNIATLFFFIIEFSLGWLFCLLPIFIELNK